MLEKYGIATEVTDGNMAHALCMLDNQGKGNPVTGPGGPIG
jgi:hypothetical protein